MGIKRDCYEVEILKKAALLVATFEKWEELRKPHHRQASYRLAFELGKLVGKKELCDNSKIDFKELIGDLE